MSGIHRSASVSSASAVVGANLIMTDRRYYDDLETRDRVERELALMAALPAHVAHAKQNSSAFARILESVDAAHVVNRAALARLPVTRKSDLMALQKSNPPFGGLTAVPYQRLGRVFSSPGPIYDPQGRHGDYFRFGRALHAAGFRPGDLVHNTFSYHFTPAGFMMDMAAQAVGCTVGQIVKSLMFRGKSSGRPLLALVSGSNRVDEKKLAALAGEPAEKADADFTRLHTGFAIGGVPPLGHVEAIETFIDEDLLQYAEVWAAAGTPHAVFRILPAELARASRGKVAAVKQN